MLNLLERAGLTSPQFLPDCGASGAGYIPGGSLSTNPQLYHQLWSLSAYPILFEGVSRSDMEDAFALWSQELDQTVSEAIPAYEELDDESSDDDASYEDSSEYNEVSSSDVQSQVRMQREESQSFANRDSAQAATKNSSSNPPFTSPSSPDTLYNVQSLSESDRDSDLHSESDRCSPESSSGDGERPPPSEIDLRSQASVAPPSPSSASCSDLSPG